MQRGNRRVPTAGQRAHLHSASCPRLPPLATLPLYTWLPAPYFCTRGGVPSPRGPAMHCPTGLGKAGPHTAAGGAEKTLESCVGRPLEARRCQTLKHSLRILLLSLIRLILARTTGFWYHRSTPLLHRDVSGRNTDGCAGHQLGGEGRERGCLEASVVHGERGTVGGRLAAALLWCHWIRRPEASASLWRRRPPPAAHRPAPRRGNEQLSFPK